MTNAGTGLEAAIKHNLEILTILLHRTLCGLIGFLCLCWRLRVPTELYMPCNFCIYSRPVYWFSDAGDCNKSIHLWEPSSNTWEVDTQPFVGHSASVEDLQACYWMMYHMSTPMCSKNVYCLKYYDYILAVESHRSQHFCLLFSRWKDMYLGYQDRKAACYFCEGPQCWCERYLLESVNLVGFLYSWAVEHYHFFQYNIVFMLWNPLPGLLAVW
jgi:hypothetical protein